MNKTVLFLLMSLIFFATPQGWSGVVLEKITFEDIWGCSDRHFQFWQKVKSQLLLDVQKNPNQPLKDYLLSKNKFWDFKHPLLQFILKTLPQKYNLQTLQQFYDLLSALDVGDISTVEKQKAVQEWRQVWNHFEVELLKKPKNWHCQKPVQSFFQSSPDNANSFRQTSASLAVWGGQKVLLTAYQSCEILALPPMTISTENVLGISIVGTHPDGVGSRRIISDLPALQRTHYYLKKDRPQNSCFDVYSQPLIYDYGGKPFVLPESSSPLNLFKNAGDGTSVLGIDCSAFVFAAYATAGLKLQKHRPLLASDVFSWGSGAYVEPEQNGLTCLSRISVGVDHNVQVGDIVAVYGHVLMIYQLGEDPFGLKNIHSLDDCANLTEDNFEIHVLQSSNSKEGIGINIFNLKDYLKTSEKMKDGFLMYAKASCQARQTGQAFVPKFSQVSIVRHQGTEDCKSGGIPLVQESCVQGCLPNKSRP